MANEAKRPAEEATEETTPKRPGAKRRASKRSGEIEQSPVIAARRKDRPAPALPVPRATFYFEDPGL